MTGDRPAITVAICTLDRADLLAGCLEALATVRRPAGGLEILVVDNGSSDHTPTVVAAHPAARRLLEPNRGLSRARNAALSRAAAPLVAFLDDDARPTPDWAVALVGAAEQWPAAAAFGGPVALEWQATRPRWLGPALERWYSGRDLGADARLLAPNEHPVGANLALRRDVARSVGGFAVELGRVGDTLGSEEEVLMLRRIRAVGWGAAWEPRAHVRHLVPGERMTVRWLLRRAWAQGRSDVVAGRLAGRPLGMVPGRAVARALLGGWPQALARLRRRGPGADDTRRSAATHELVRRTRRLASAWALLTAPDRHPVRDDAHVT